MNTSSRTLVSVIVCVAGFAGTAHAQTLTPLAPTYRARVLGELARVSQPGITTATAISESGLAVGYSWEYGQPARGWAWNGASMHILQPPSSMAGAWTYANAVNAQGVIAGTIEFEGRSYGATWHGGEVSLLDPIHAGESAGAAAINDAGLVTGGSWPGGIVWRNGSTTGAALPLIDGATKGSAFHVNNSGTFAGYGVRPDERAYPARWSETGVGEWLAVPSEPAGAQDFVGTQLTGMNQRGDVIGWTTSYGFTGTGQLWRAGRDGEFVEIGDFDPQNPGLVVPSGINDSAWIVGLRDVPGAARGAFLWIEGAMFNVADLLEPGSGLTLLSADEINNEGVIVGTALMNDRIVPVLLTPVPSPGGAAGLFIAGVLVAARRRR